MGMYTELHLNVELIEDVPDDVITILKIMCGTLDASFINEVDEELINHPLFIDSDWMFMLFSDSYYFPSKTNSSVSYDNISKTFFLNIRCNLKNYSNEIENFLDWISNYCDVYGPEFVGYYRYEENRNPILIYFDSYTTGSNVYLSFTDNNDITPLIVHRKILI